MTPDTQHNSIQHNDNHHNRLLSTLSINDNQHKQHSAYQPCSIKYRYAECCNAGCRYAERRGSPVFA
jgi:hypothetical protein